MKPSDRWAISLCEFHHREQHTLGENSFQELYEIDLVNLAREFASRSPYAKRLGISRAAHADVAARD